MDSLDLPAEPAEGATPSTSSPPEPRSRTFIALVAVLVILAAIAAFQTVNRMRRNSVQSALREHADEATAALAEHLKTIPTADRTPFLLKSIHDESPGLRFAAVDALAQHPQAVAPEIVDELEKAYEDSSSLVRGRVLETLPSIDPKRGFRLLLAGLRDEDDWMRETAVTQLNLLISHKPVIIDEHAIPVLVHALDDPSFVVSDTASSALSKLTGNAGSSWRLSRKTPPQEAVKIRERWRKWFASARATLNVDDRASNVPAIRPTRKDAMTSFSTTDIDGNRITLDSLRGKVTLVNFWGTWCAACKLEVPDLVRIDKDFRDRGVDVIGFAVAEQKSPEELRAWCKEHGVSYRQGLSSVPLQETFGHVEDVPVTILIDREGNIRYRWEGERIYDTFRDALERVLAEPAGRPSS